MTRRREERGEEKEKGGGVGGLVEKRKEEISTKQYAISNPLTLTSHPDVTSQ